jgi:hypothetical protein
MQISSICPAAISIIRQNTGNITQQHGCLIRKWKHTRYWKNAIIIIDHNPLANSTAAVESFTFTSQNQENIQHIEYFLFQQRELVQLKRKYEHAHDYTTDHENRKRNASRFRFHL